MKKMLFCFRMPVDNTYTGGIASILSSYLKHAALFEKQGFEPALFNYPLQSNIKNSKINNILYIVYQRRALFQRLRQEQNVVLNIQTSRDYLFLKDILLARVVKKKYGIPVILTIHVGIADTVFNRIHCFEKFAIKVLNKYVDKTVLLTDKIRAEFIARGLAEDRAVVLRNFHCLEPDDQVSSVVDSDELRLLYVGALHREKGVIDLLSALASLENVNFHLDLCGVLSDHSIEEEFNSLINRLGEKVTVHGYVNGSAKTRLYNQADILALPSYHEGMPMVIVEALAGNCAIISTRVGATPEILTDDNAIWVDIGNVNQISNAVTHFYNDRALLEKMKYTNGKKAEDFTLERNIQRLCDICSHR